MTANKPMDQRAVELRGSKWLDDFHVDDPLDFQGMSINVRQGRQRRPIEAIYDPPARHVGPVHRVRKIRQGTAMERAERLYGGFE